MATTVQASALGAAASFVLALVASEGLRRFGVRRSLVDVPNARSLHTNPVPRLGGVAIVGSVLATSTLLGLCTALPSRDHVVWLATGVVVSLLGLLDDLRPLPPGIRLALQAAAAAALVFGTELVPRVPITPRTNLEIPAALAAGAAIVYVVGTLNIYNFMDGMDGLAASQAVGAGLALAGAFALHGHLDLAVSALVLACASAGFLAHNYPPATLFMGDAGSTFLGFSFAALGLIAIRRNDPVPLVVAPMALAPFLLDGSFTLLRRILRRERVWQAHRTHLYQRAVTTGLDHRAVLVPYMIWIAASSSCAVLASRGSDFEVIGLSLFLVASLVAVWRWVVAREQRLTRGETH